MVKALLTGICGQMGQEICRIAICRSDIEIIAGIDKSAINSDVKTFLSFGDCNVNAEVLIDFSHSSAFYDVLEYCQNHKLPLVIGTTGLNSVQTDALKNASEKIPIFYSANMSTGVLFFHKLVKYASQLLCFDYDIEIVESHHKNKSDSPSGTAKALYETIRSATDINSVSNGHAGKRKDNSIGIHSIRGGGIVGNHEVMFVGDNDCITLSHSAFNKSIFAIGALDAAVFISSKQSGLYDMSSLIEGKE